MVVHKNRLIGKLMGFPVPRSKQNTEQTALRKYVYNFTNGFIYRSVGC